MLNSSNGLITPVVVKNANGKSQFVFVCDHASNFIPKEYDNLGLNYKDQQRHIAWDPGSLAVAKILAKKLDAPLVHSTISRLIIDNNRAIEAKDLIPKISENTVIFGNKNIDVFEQQNRVDTFHEPYHQAIESLLNERKKMKLQTILITIHSFNPTYNGVSRPWSIGLIHAQNESYSRYLFNALNDIDKELNVGWNEPYSEKDGVCFTLKEHGDKRNLHSSMIEIRNDEIRDAAGVSKWARILENSLLAACVAI